MEKPFLPTVEGRIVAQDILERPETSRYRIREYGYQLMRHYKETGLARHNLPRAIRMTTRAMLRAAAAPVRYLTEKALTAHIQTEQTSGRALVVPEDLAKTCFDRQLTDNGRRQYTDSQLKFLRACSSLGYAAAIRPIALMMTDNASPHRHLWHTFWDIDTEAALLEFPGASTRSTPRERLLDHLVASNVTVLSLLTPTVEHVRRYSPTEDLGTALLRRVAQLSWPSSAKSDFFERHFSGPELDAQPPLSCPFTHDSDAFVSDNVWGVSSLKEGPWPVEGYCPANIPFRSGQGYITAVELRLASAIHIGRETLWAQ